ncbi:hypothetical protein EII29_02575 [Leptotrichia sp. OH3620_COT-345]|uniref:hypothetical protein n=1 Tax=Leptotrichia sp. OH3620_COT-345 TaxID=2491048 RepID=UPI000F6533A8|nr:hypothetical protein [Leptotrichia sp. OH3620_COT-345]RRD40383.1 hypothetical protein EII29_02575 [Leptotrichia sp. OH3620_COT-345]
MRKHGFTVKKVSNELGLTYFKFKELAISGTFNFVTVIKGKSGRNSYHFDPLKTIEYINEYKEKAHNI